MRIDLPYRRPFGFDQILEFLGARAVDGVESVDGESYTRTLSLPGGPGVVRVHDAGGFLRADLDQVESDDAPIAEAKLRHLFDLDLDPVAMEGVLSSDPHLRPAVEATPGLRVPGSVDGGEILMRAIVGQQITVRGATGMISAMSELMPRLPFEGPVDRLFPSPLSIAERGYRLLRGPKARAETLRRAAEALVEVPSLVAADRNEADLRRDLERIPGVGAWTSGYVAMRALASRDIFLERDSAVRAGAGELGIERPSAGFAERFRPWRSYLTVHLWNASAGL